MQRFLVLVFCCLLTACSGLRLVDSEVQASSTLGSATLAGARYRYERLPSQTSQPQFARLEQLADTALQQVGLVRDDRAARYSVLLGVRTQVHWASNEFPPFRRLWGPLASQYPRFNPGVMLGWDMRYPPPTLYLREVSLLLRDLQTGNVVYETRAINDSPWPDDDPILLALLQSALTDFPTPPAGRRTINLEIPR